MKKYCSALLSFRPTGFQLSHNISALMKKYRPTGFDHSVQPTLLDLKYLFRSRKSEELKNVEMKNAENAENEEAEIETDKK